MTLLKNPTRVSATADRPTSYGNQTIKLLETLVATVDQKHLLTNEQSETESSINRFQSNTEQTAVINSLDS